MDDLIKSLRRIAKVQYGATVDEAREVSKVLRDTATALESQQTELTRLRSLVSGEDAQLQLIAQEREALRADAERYRAFFDAGLPICFCGVDYWDKASLDAAIDMVRNARPADFEGGES